LIPVGNGCSVHLDHPKFGPQHHQQQGSQPRREPPVEIFGLHATVVLINRPQIKYVRVGDKPLNLFQAQVDAPEKPIAPNTIFFVSFGTIRG
jgi:hypothetical protein